MEQNEQSPPGELTPEREQELIAEHRRSLVARWEAGAMTPKQLLEALGGGSVGMRLTSYPENARERDDQAIAWLSHTLDEGANPGTGWPLTGERWSTILARRIANKVYPRQQTARATWIWRHYHVRQLSHSETPQQSATHVAAIWSRHGRRVTVPTILAAAKLSKNKAAALAWIEQCIAGTNSPRIPGWPVITESQTYQALDRAIERDIAPEYPAGTK